MDAATLAANIKRRKLAKARFKAMVRAIMLNQLWVGKQEEEPISSNVKRNLAIFTRRQRRTGILTVAEKVLIQKPSFMRTIEDRKALVKLIVSLPCFQNYSPKVRARIAPYLYYNYITAGRTLFREGDEPIMVYFLLNGECVSTQHFYDKLKDVYYEVPLFISGSGDTVGYSSFILGERRCSTVRVTRDTEVLYLISDEYIEYLLPEAMKKWMRIRHAVESFEIFNFFDETQISYACQMGLVKQYEPMQTIYHEDSGLLNFIYFVLSGECMILQSLKIKTKNDDKIENHFTDVGSLKVGAIFGVGEKMEQRAILARTMVQCLLLPRYWLFERKQNPGNMWQRMIFYLNTTIPSKSLLFKDFINTRKWHQFKKKVIQNYLSEALLPNPTKMEDIPVLCRIIENTFED